MGKFYLNKVMLAGDVCTDVTYSVTQNGQSKAQFTLAVARDYDKNVKDFVFVNAFNHIAEFATDNLIKGASVFVEGSIRIRAVPNPQGTKYYTSVLADAIDIINRPNTPPVNQMPTEQPPIDDDDDLPF